MDPTAVDLLQFVPRREPWRYFQTVPSAERGDQFTVKLDHHINYRQNFSFYYYFDDHDQVSPFAQFQAAGANVPGFGSNAASVFSNGTSATPGRSPTAPVNEFRFNYNREGAVDVPASRT